MSCWFLIINKKNIKFNLKNLMCNINNMINILIIGDDGVQGYYTDINS